jgi:hypothetical protein
VSGLERVDQANHGALIFLGQLEHFLEAFPETTRLGVLLGGGLGSLGRLRAEELVGADLQSLRELNDDVGGRKVGDGLVLGNRALGGADELGELDLGETASTAKVHESLTKRGARRDFGGHNGQQFRG